MIWWDLHVWWLWVSLRQGLALGPPCQDTSRWLTIAQIEADLLSTTLEVQTCSNLYRTLQHQKDSWQSTPHVCFLFLHRLHQLFVFLLVKRPLFPPSHAPNHQAPPNHQTIINSKKHLQNHTALHSPQKSLTPRNPTCQWKTTIFNRSYILNGCISMVILVFRSVHVLKD